MNATTSKIPSPAADLRRAKKLLADNPDLVRRVINIAEGSARYLQTPICTAREAHAALLGRLDGLANEELHAMYVDHRNQVIAIEQLTVGSARFTVVDPRQIFEPAVRLRAAAVVLAHNHPSGDPTPSAQDREVTRRVVAAGRVLAITLLDHLVIGSAGWISMRESGDMDPSDPSAGSMWTS